LRSYETLYRKEGNPMYAWMALREIMRPVCPPWIPKTELHVPSWCVQYFLAASRGLLDLAHPMDEGNGTRIRLDVPRSKLPRLRDSTEKIGKVLGFTRRGWNGLKSYRADQANMRLRISHDVNRLFEVPAERSINSLLDKVGTNDKTAFRRRLASGRDAAPALLRPRPKVKT
jgi:hypothetical protein